MVAELGDLGGKVDSQKRGFIVHSVLLLAADGGRTLGLLEQARWCRPVAQRGQRQTRDERAYAAKESFKWQRASERLARRLGATQARVISGCDRDADVYAYLQHKVSHAERFLVRASWDRRVAGEAAHLFEALERAPLLGSQVVSVPQRGGAQARRARCAHLEICTARVQFRGPRRAAGAGCVGRAWGVGGGAAGATRPGAVVLAVVDE